MDDAIISLQISEEDLQSFFEANFGRRLTPMELLKIAYEVTIAGTDLFGAIMHRVTENAMTERTNRAL